MARIIIVIFFRYWYVLQEECLYCYLTPDDRVTVDVTDLDGYTVTSLEDKFPGQRFVLHLEYEVRPSLASVPDPHPHPYPPPSPPPRPDSVSVLRANTEREGGGETQLCFCLLLSLSLSI